MDFTFDQLYNFRRNPDKTQNLLHESGEEHVIPSSSPYVIRLIEVPDNGSIQSRPIIVDFTERYDVNNSFLAPIQNTFQVNYNTGDIVFNSANADETVLIDYWKKGTLINADHFNNIADHLKLLNDEVLDLTQNIYNDISNVIKEIEMIYAKRIDFVGETLIYKGEAEVGTLDSEAVQRIHRLTIIDEDVFEEWASGNSNFDKVQDDRYDYIYI